MLEEGPVHCVSRAYCRHARRALRGRSDGQEEIAKTKGRLGLAPARARVRWPAIGAFGLSRWFGVVALASRESEVACRERPLVGLDLYRISLRRVAGGGGE